MLAPAARQRVPGYCALCISRCGCISVIEDGRLVAVEPDPSHPTGKALCAKGRAAPGLVYNSQRLLYPMRRTRPKGDPDPGWIRITWDEALDVTARRLREIAERAGPEAIVFAPTTTAGTALSDSSPWILRLISAFGSPNNCWGLEICAWHKFYATRFTFGVGLPAQDFEASHCMLFWGHNPGGAWLARAGAAVAARRRGAKLIGVDPRQVNLAAKADIWLRVRPGTDCALALGIAGVMIAKNRFDREFIRDWSNGPLLVREDTHGFLTERDLSPHGSSTRYLAWDEVASRPLVYDPTAVAYERADAEPALFGSYRVATRNGEVTCRPAFDLYAALCRQYPPEVVEQITWVPAAQVHQAAHMLWESRPVSYHTWSALEQNTNATQTNRAIALLYALTGSFDAPGGNVIFPSVPTADVSGTGFLSNAQRRKALGLHQHPLGPPRSGLVTTRDVYNAILTGQPYPVRGLVAFGANLLLSHADVQRGKRALDALEFYVHADLFMNPTAECADVVLPVATCWEREALRVGFEISLEAQSLVQLRPAAVPPLGETRPDTEIVFDLACRLGLGDHFWHGDIDAAYRHLLQPSGLSLEELRQRPEGVRVPLSVRYRKYAERSDGVRTGFATPTRKVEIYSQLFLEHGYAPLPVYEEPLVGPVADPDLAARYPLILTCAKLPYFCLSQHRAIPSLRRLAPDPEVEMHPDAAADRGIVEGVWVMVETPAGRIRARARFRDSLDPRVVCGYHGWWQSCPELGLSGYDTLSSGGANYNLLIANDVVDPISGSVPHRTYLCQIQVLNQEDPVPTRGISR